MNRFHVFARVLWPVVVLILVALVGCETNHYELDLKLDGETLQRKLTCWCEGPHEEKKEFAPFPKEDLARISEAYDQPADAARAKKHVFQGKFADRTPDDVGGYGSFENWETPLGSTAVYVERFRGNDDLVLSVEQRQKAAVRLAELLGGWLATQLADDPRVEKLKKFLNNQFRHDLQNISLYSWSFEFVGAYGEGAQKELIVRAVQYLVERDYFSVDQLPLLFRAFEDSQRGDPTKALSILQRLVADKMGVEKGKSIPKSLSFLGDAAFVETSLNEYVRGTNEYAELLKRWEIDNREKPDTPMPQPKDVLQTLVTQALLPNFQLFAGADQLAVNLATGHEPFLTNGKWSKKAKQVKWSEAIPKSKSDRLELPKVMFAFWSTPKVMIQESHFGKVVLEGDRLGKYCLWYRGLSKHEADQWDEFVKQLKPTKEKELVRRIESFRFADEPEAIADDDGHDLLSSTPRELILPQLTE